MSKRSRRLLAFATLTLSVVLFVAVNIAANVWLRTARLDLTQTGLYTVSQGTRATLAKLQEPVTLRFFYSRDAAAGYPAIATYAGRVRDLLQEYAALSRGKIVVEEINPEPFTQAEDDAVAAGLSGAPTQEGETVYFGIAGSNTLDGHEAIPFLESEREPYLEYDLTSLVYRLATPKKPKLGIMSSLPLEAGSGGMLAALQGNAQPFAIYEQLRQTFDIQSVQQDVDQIPADVSTLLIVHPTGLGPRTLYAIDQFVLKGGHAIVFVDPDSEIAGAASGGGGAPPGNTASDLGPLLKAWGVDFDSSKVVADADLAQRVRVGSAANPQALDYIVWLKLSAPNFDAKDPVTGNLQQLNVATVGALKPSQGASTKFTPLIHSSSNANLLDSAVVRITQNPADLLRHFEPAGGNFTIAARLSGPAKTAFPQGAPAAAPPAPKSEDPGAAPPPPPAPLPAAVAESKGINVIVVADTDLLDDKFWVNAQNVLGQRVVAPIADNGAFVVNAVENMMGSNDLISLRTRAPADRPFTVVQQLQRDAEGQFLAQEQQLQDRVKQTEASLRALEGGGDAQGVAQNPTKAEVLTAEQQATVEKFRKQLIDTRASLRGVQANLRRDVEALGAALAMINIALVPILVAIAAVAVGALRRRRRILARGM